MIQAQELPRREGTGYILRRSLVWVTDNEFWITCLVVPLLLFPNRWTWVGLMALLLLWLARFLQTRQLICRTPLDLPILLLLLMVPVSLYVTVDLQLSLVGMLQILAGTSLFYAAVNGLVSSKHLVQLICFLILAGLGLALVAPLGTEWATDKVFALPQVYDKVPRSLPETVHPNVLAGAIVLVVPFVLGLLLFPQPATGKTKVLMVVFLVLALVMMTGTVILTQSRGAYVALGAGLFVVATARFRWLGFIIPLLALALLTVVHTVGTAAVVDAFLHSGALGSWEGRQEVWSRALYMMRDFPYTGIGLGTFGKVAPVMYPYFILGPGAVVPHAHNLFLQVGVDLGIPGLIAFLAMLTSTLFMAARAYVVSRRLGEKTLTGISLGLLGGLVALVIHGLVDAVTWGSKASFLPWLLFAATVIAYRQTLRGET